MTIIRRAVASVPARSASATWERIVDLIAPNENGKARQELAAVAGVVCSCITDEALRDDPLVVYGAGPRLRIYALYGDDALEGDDASESPLTYVPTDGDWHVSLPCLPDDLPWVQRSLKVASRRVIARATGTDIEEPLRNSDQLKSSGDHVSPLDLDHDAFFRR